MKSQFKTTALLLSLVAAGALAAQSQTVTDPCPNRVISWNFDNNGTINPTDLTGLAPATNWANSWPANPTLALPDNTGAATTLDLNYGSFNGWSVGGHPGLDANGTANRELLNGYLNSGPAAWGPWTSNTWVSLTNVPYAVYDVIVYFNADASGRKSSIEGPTATYHFSTMGSAVRSGANASFLPTTETNTSIFPTADFAVWRGLTTPNARFTTYPKSGNDQWLGICGFQVIESSNAYCLYGPSPATQIVPIGQPASFSVIAGGQNIKYQWRRAGVPIANATNATYSIAATIAGQDGAYDVVITNSFSSITSAVATLTFYSPKSLEWAGSVDGTWNTGTANWKTNAATASTIYTETDNVLFGPLGSAQPFVTLDAARSPSSLTVSNGSYTFTGGSLNGSGTLRLRNNATFILDTADNRSGPTIIDAGSTFQLGNNDTLGAMGSGPLTNNGALLFNAAGDEAYGYPIYGTGSITNLGSLGLITLGSDIRGNYLVQAGFGSLLLQGSNTLSGGLIVSGGQVWARAQDCLGQGPTILSGGELQLNFTLNYSGTSMSLAGGTLRGGVGGANTYAGVVSLATDSQINVDSGSGLTLNHAAGVNGGAFNLSLGGGGTLILAGANNTWASLTINNGTVQIGNGGSTASVGSGPLNNAGALTFNTSSSLTVTNDIVGFGTVNQNGSGLTTLTADLSTSGFSGAFNVNAGTLRINNNSGSGNVLVNGGALGGTGTIGGSVDVLPGGALAPGASIGNLTINGNLTLGGNVAVEVNRSASPSNDVVTVVGSIANTNNGVVSVSNLGGALAVGNKFTLFNQPVIGGATMSISGAGVVWANNLEVDGSIQVVSIGVPQPRIVSTTVSGGNLVFSGTNGVPGNAYQVVSSTNVATPLSSWLQTSTGNFDGSGHFSVTNAINANEPQRYYLLRLP